MKFLFASALLLFALQSSLAQSSCVDLSAYDNSYLNAVSFDDATYPIGSAFITSGYIQYVKPSSGNNYQFIQGDSLLYIGDIDIDVSMDTCANHTLSFSSVYVEGLSVDGTVVFDMLNAPSTFVGNGWTFSKVGQTYKVTGDFDVVSLFTQTNYLFDVCLECVVSSGTCVNLSAYDDAYLNAVSFDDVTYPIGSAFVTSGYIQYVKPSSGNAYQFIQGDSLLYIGDIDIDVSTDPCIDHTLTFSSVFLYGLSIDGIVVFAAGNPPASYVGNGWTFTWLGGVDYQVSGDFDVVSLSSSTNFLFDVCLVCNSNSGTCVNLSAYDDAYLNAVSFDDVTYPIGSAFVTSGYIQYVKPSSGNAYQFIQGDSLLYIGDIDIDVSTDPCVNHTLTFSSVFLYGLSVDGVDVFTSGNPPASYVGNGWTFTWLGGEDYQVSGDFDVVSLSSSTNFLFDVCLVCNSNSGTCVNLSAYDDAYLNAVSFDDVTYPIGSAFVTSGYIQYVKPSSGNAYQFIQGDSLLYIGDIDIDVSTDPCVNHTLTFSSVFLYGLSVDGVDVFTSGNPPASYVGNGWTFTWLGGEDYQVSGDFDVVSLSSSTNFLFDVCLVCNTSGIDEVEANSLRVYPNPSNGVVYVELSGPSEISVYTLSGQLVERQQGSGTVLSFDLRPGSYIITSEDEFGMNMQQRIVVF